MLGIKGSSLVGELVKVAEDLNEKPDGSVDIRDYFSEDTMEELADRYGIRNPKDYYRIPPSHMQSLPMDVFEKIKHSTIMMASRHDGHPMEDPEESYSVVAKLRSSAWRWGCGGFKWNDLVDAYHGMRDFNFGLPNFGVTIDFPQGFNPCGRALRHPNVWIDASLAFMVYYRKKHVMTVGFAITAEREILIHQVQLANPRGNRFLYRMPVGRLEHVIDRFAVAFPKFKLRIIDGYSAAEKVVSAYAKSIDHHEKSNWGTGDIEDLCTRRDRAEADKHRLANFYYDVGPHKIYPKDAIRVMDTTFLLVEPTTKLKTLLERPEVFSQIDIRESDDGTSVVFSGDGLAGAHVVVKGKIHNAALSLRGIPWVCLASLNGNSIYELPSVEDCEYLGMNPFFSRGANKHWVWGDSETVSLLRLVGAKCLYPVQAGA